MFLFHRLVGGDNASASALRDPFQHLLRAPTEPSANENDPPSRDIGRDSDGRAAICPVDQRRRSSGIKVWTPAHQAPAGSLRLVSLIL